MPDATETIEQPTTPLDPGMDRLIDQLPWRSLPYLQVTLSEMAKQHPPDAPDLEISGREVAAFHLGWGACAREIQRLALQCGAEEIWQAWYKLMLLQGREVAPERQAWTTLSAEDQRLDTMLALVLSRRVTHALMQNQPRP